MTKDYIFCPFCGGIKWTTDKSGQTNHGQLESYECSDCKKFYYSNHIEHTKSKETGIEIFSKQRYKVEAKIESYTITVNYIKNTTLIEYTNGYGTVIELKHAVNFNWYKNEELMEKIKTYLVFS